MHHQSSRDHGKNKAKFKFRNFRGAIWCKLVQTLHHPILGEYLDRRAFEGSPALLPTT